MRKIVVVSLCSLRFSAARNSLHALDALDALTTCLRTQPACKFTEASLELEGLALCLNELELFLRTALVKFHRTPELLEDITVY